MCENCRDGRHDWCYGTKYRTCSCQLQGHHQVDDLEPEEDRSINRVWELMAEAPPCPTCGLPMVKHGRPGPARYCPFDGWQETKEDISEDR